MTAQTKRMIEKEEERWLQSFNSTKKPLEKVMELENKMGKKDG